MRIVILILNLIIIVNLINCDIDYDDDDGGGGRGANFGVYTRKPQNCLDLYIKCDRNDNNCQLDVIILKKMCGDYITDSSTFYECDAQLKENCRGAIKTMNRKPGFSTCQCDNRYYGDSSNGIQKFTKCRRIWKMLNQHPCITDKQKQRDFQITKQEQQQQQEQQEQQTKSSRQEDELYKELVSTGLRVVLGGLGLFAEQGQSGDTSGSSNSCISKQQMCSQNNECYLARRNFDNSCRFHNCDKNGDECVTLYQTLRQHGLFDCSCVYQYQLQPSNMKRCLKIQATLRDNKCLAFLNNRVMYQTLTFTTNPNKADSKTASEIMPKELQSLTVSNPNCIVSYQKCIQSSQCLQRYLEMGKACNCTNANSAISYQYNQCLRTVRSFYSRPDLVTLNSIRCQCPASTTVVNDNNSNAPPSYSIQTSSSDMACIRQQRVFQPSCIKQESSNINCLELMQKCLNDTGCLDSFTVFSQLCSPIQRNPTKYCPTHYFRCLDAYRTIWGSILTSQCSCQQHYTNQIANQHYSWATQPMTVCEFFKKLLAPPQCITVSQDNMDQQSNINNNERPQNLPYRNDDPCLLIRKHKIPHNEYVRVQSLNFDGSKNNCPRVCKCNQNCFQIPCGSPTNYSSTQFMCALFNLPRDKCSCRRYIITCHDFYLPNVPNDVGYRSSDYKLIIEYNLSEFILIRRSKLISGISDIISNLNSLMLSTTGFKNCRLRLSSSHDNYLTFLLEINIKRPVSRRNPTLWIYEPSEQERLKHLNTECVMSVKLLQLMINERYGDIIHNLPLSILQQADLIVPARVDLIASSASQNNNNNNQSPSAQNNNAPYQRRNHSSSTFYITSYFNFIFFFITSIISSLQILI